MMSQPTTRGPEASLDEIEGVYGERAVQFERIAAAIVRDREAARDVVQDAFATVVRKRIPAVRRFRTFERLPATAASLRLTSIEAMHPTAKVYPPVTTRPALPPCASPR